MTHDDAIDFLRSAGPWHGSWADVGAGQGTFTRALAELIGPHGSVLAIDSDARAVAALKRTSRSTDGTVARITAARGDMQDLASIAELRGVELDGFLFANALHFTRAPDTVLTQAVAQLRTGGRIVVIEYDRTMPNPWVPHPLPFERLTAVARSAGFGEPVEVARRSSAYHREMYCAVIGR